MVRGTVILALIFVACVYAAPEPRSTKVTLLRDSSLGYSVAAGSDKKAGSVDGTKTVDIDLPDDIANKNPEITLLENVNSGAGISLSASLNFGQIKDSLLAGKNPFWRKK